MDNHLKLALSGRDDSLPRVASISFTSYLIFGCHMKSINMPIQFICIMLLMMMMIVAQTQPVASLTLESMKLNSNNTNDGANGSADTSSSSMKMSTPSPTQNGTYNKQVSDLFKDLSTYSDKMNAQAGINRTLQMNSSFGPTDVEPEDESSLIISAIVANILIFVIGFCGNSLVILVILKFTRIETVTDIYILNLAFADLMFLFGLIFLITTMFIDHWIFGNLMCKLYMASTSLNQFASSLLLVVMSFDRYLAVCHPIYAQRFRRLRRAKIICLCIWIMCLILMTPIFAFAKTDKALTCAIFWPEYKSFNYERAFTLYSFAIGFAVPLSLIAAFYNCVIRKLRIAASGPIGAGSTRRSRTRETTNKRIEHLVIGIICTYTICWLPYWIAQLLVSFSTHLDSTPITGFYPFILLATCLSYTNSALNPILYAFLSDNFKRRCADVFRSIYPLNWCRGPHNQETYSTVATGLCDHSELHNQNHIYISTNNNNNKINSESVKQMKSRQSVVIGDSALNSTRLSGPQKPVPNEDERVGERGDVFGAAIDHSQDCHAIDKTGTPTRDHMIDNSKCEIQCSKAQAAIDNMQHLQHSDLDQTTHLDMISNPHRSNTIDCNGNYESGLAYGYKLDSKDHADFHTSQTKLKSVAFSIGTFVVEGPINKL